MQFLSDSQRPRRSQRLKFFFSYAEAAVGAETAGQLAEERFSIDQRTANPWNAATCLFTAIMGVVAQCGAFFSEIAKQGKNATVNLVFTTFILFHSDVAQEWRK